MNRRKFVSGLAATAACNRAWTQTPAISLTIDQPSPQAVPAEFVGLSYESAQLANPHFFAAENKELIALFRTLAPSGNLRLGGGSSEYTTYSDDAPAGPLPFEVFGPDTSKTVKHGTVTSALALRNLRAFLDAVNWSCLYGLNLGQGTVENAVREAAAVTRILGPRLMALQIGNEPDSFRNRYRPASYGPEDYLAEWNRFHTAIAQAVPGAKFAGPDISNKLPYLTAFAAETSKHKDVVLLTSHYYAMGPAGNPQATLENLLDPDPKLTTLKRRDLHIIAEAQAAAGLPYRMSEGNSCWNGGQPGVSDVFASALWCANYMLAAMQRGWAGVNLHGGGNGVYSPIVGAPSTGFSRRPEYFGMQFAQHFVGARPVACTLTGADPHVEAFVFARSQECELAIINKTGTTVPCTLPAGWTGQKTLELTAPAIDARDGVVLHKQHDTHRNQITAAGYSATVFALAGGRKQ